MNFANKLIAGGFLKGYKTILGVGTIVLGVFLPWAYGDATLVSLFTPDNLKILGGAISAWGIGSKLNDAISGGK